MAHRRTTEEERISTAVRLPASLHDRLHRTANERAFSANLLVTRALEDHLDRLPPLDVILEASAPRSDKAARS